MIDNDNYWGNMIVVVNYWISPRDQQIEHHVNPGFMLAPNRFFDLGVPYFNQSDSYRFWLFGGLQLPNDHPFFQSGPRIIKPMTSIMTQGARPPIPKVHPPGSGLGPMLGQGRTTLSAILWGLRSAGLRHGSELKMLRHSLGIFWRIHPFHMNHSQEMIVWDFVNYLGPL